MQTMEAKTKIERITEIAYTRAKAGMRPDLAWADSIRALYPPDKVKSQLQHSCPKWAFSILCHRGLVTGVAGGSCPAAEGMRSASFVLQARASLLSEPALANQKRELIRRVFGEKGMLGYRTPNDEVEVLLSLMKTRVVRL